MGKEAVALRSRSLWIYLLIALTLSAIYFKEFQSGKRRIAEKISTMTMFELDPSSVSFFSIDKGSTRIVVTRTNEGDSETWFIKSPIRAKADGLRVRKFLEKLSKLRWVREIAKRPEDISEFGLDKPAVVIAFTAENISGTLRIGSLTPLGDDVYVQRNGDQAVYTISFADKYDLDVDLFDLRDKRLITISPENVLKLVIERRGKSPWLLRKRGDRWFFGNGPTEADPERIHAILSRLWTMRATSIVEEKARDLSQYGLTDPAVGIRVISGKKEEEILIGNVSRQGDELYAKMVGSPMVVTIKKWILSDIPPTEKGLRKSY